MTEDPKLVTPPVTRTIQQLLPAQAWQCQCTEQNGLVRYPLVAWVLTADSSTPPIYKLEGAYVESGQPVDLCENHPGFMCYLPP